jgi:peptide deformylase
VLINPKIEEYSKQTYTTYEGCLSFDGLRAEVRRAKWIKATYYDEQGRLHQEKLEGFIANVFQHEIDHLNGTLFVDHLEDIKTIMTTEEFERSFANKHKK